MALKICESFNHSLASLERKPDEPDASPALPLSNSVLALQRARAQRPRCSKVLPSYML